MNLLDTYYRFERLSNSRSKSRLDLVTCTQTYEPLQKQSKAWVYLIKVPQHIRGNRERKSKLCLVGSDGNYISGVFIPEITKPEIGYGDIKGTTDAALFLLGENSLEILIAKGKKNTAFALYQLLADGELDREIKILKQIIKSANSAII